MSRNAESALRDALAENIDPDAAAEALAADPDELLIPWRRFMQTYELDALDRYRDGLAKLELLPLGSATIGVMFERDHVPSAKELDEPLVNVLRQLWAASVEAGGETLALL